MKNQVLDKGFIEVVDSLGSDLTVVNSARVSFGKRKEKWDKSDEKNPESGVHLLMYFVDAESSLNKLLKTIRKNKEIRNILKKLSR